MIQTTISHSETGHIWVEEGEDGMLEMTCDGNQTMKAANRGNIRNEPFVSRRILVLQWRYFTLRWNSDQFSRIPKKIQYMPLLRIPGKLDLLYLCMCMLLTDGRMHMVMVRENRLAYCRTWQMWVAAEDPCFWASGPSGTESGECVGYICSSS